MHAVVRWPSLLALVTVVSLGLLIGAGIVIILGAVDLFGISSTRDSLRNLF